MLWIIELRQNLLALLSGDLVRRWTLWTSPQVSFSWSLASVLERPWADPYHLTGLVLTCASLNGLINHFEDLESFPNVVLASSSSHNASDFFESNKGAAASANAASLRFSSALSCLTWFATAFSFFRFMSRFLLIGFSALMMSARHSSS